MAKKEKNKRMAHKGQRLIADHRGLLILAHEYQLFCSECGAEAGVLATTHAAVNEDPIVAICSSCKEEIANGAQGE